LIETLAVGTLKSGYSKGKNKIKNTCRFTMSFSPFFQAIVFLKEEMGSVINDNEKCGIKEE